jgi:proteasome assembly chaperone (PAC2) family protein
MMRRMNAPSLRFSSTPALPGGTLLLALSGWMDGGNVSTGTIRGIMDGRELERFAEIKPDPFYIYNFPGSMEVAALFRPTVKYDEGMIVEYETPANEFFADESAGLAFFIGREPHLRWDEFAECIFEVTEKLRIQRMIFMGSFGGTVPHTREPRMFATVSDSQLKPLIVQHGMRFSDYEGPSGFATRLLAECPKRDIQMMSLVCEIPGYLQGPNPLSIEAITRRLARILNVTIDVDRMRRASDEWEVRVTQAVEEDAELAETVKKLEQEYDNELIEEK